MGEYGGSETGPFRGVVGMPMIHRNQKENDGTLLSQTGPLSPPRGRWLYLGQLQENSPTTTAFP